MIDINKLSKTYKIRILDNSDADLIVNLCKQNTLFYKYTVAKPTLEYALKDINSVPPGMTLKDKYYVGFFEGNELVAILDLIDGYPNKETVYIGFFMMNIKFQRKGIGSSIIQEVELYLKSISKLSIRLAVDDKNPQSSHFWTKCGFKQIKDSNINGWIKHVYEKMI